MTIAHRKAKKTENIEEMYQIYKENPTLENRNNLILESYEFIRAICRKYYNISTLLDYEDLIHFGIKGVIVGIEKLNEQNKLPETNKIKGYIFILARNCIITESLVFKYTTINRYLKAQKGKIACDIEIDNNDWIKEKIASNYNIENDFCTKEEIETFQKSIKDVINHHKQYGQIIELRSLGLTTEEIGKKINKSKQYVSQVLNKYAIPILMNSIRKYTNNNGREYFFCNK